MKLGLLTYWNIMDLDIWTMQRQSVMRFGVRQTEQKVPQRHRFGVLFQTVHGEMWSTINPTGIRLINLPGCSVTDSFPEGQGWGISESLFCSTQHMQGALLAGKSRVCNAQTAPVWQLSTPKFTAAPGTNTGHDPAKEEFMRMKRGKK